MTPAASGLDVTGRAVTLRDLDLDRFFRPRTVAVIGASDAPDRPNTLMTTKLREWADHHGATLYPVNPRRETLGDLRCAPSIAAIDDEIDLAVVLVSDAIGAFEEARDAGAKFAVIFTAGFAESGPSGVRLQQRLADLVADGETHLLGPNTNLNAFELFDQDAEKKLALISQSGHQGRPIFQARDIGLKMSGWAPTGNEVDLEFADFVRHFADQPETGVVAAYVEGFRDGRTLQLAADHAARRGVPIVCVKVGRTAAGRSMAKSHTGHLTGSDVVTDAVFRQFGVIRVDSLDELQDTGMLFTRAKAPAADGVCIYSISGGTGAHLADMCAAAELHVPPLGRDTRQLLHQWIPTYLRVSNPVDNGGPPTADERGIQILRAILADPAIGVLMAPITGAVPTMGLALAEDLVTVGEESDKPVCVIWGAPTTDDPAYEVLVESSLPLFRTFGNCVGAVKAYLDHHAFQKTYRSPFERPVRRRSPASSRASELVREADGALAEHRSKELLSAYGIPVTRDVLCHSSAEAARAASALGWPVVAKVASADLVHKSDHRLVEVGISSLQEVRRAYRALLDRAHIADPEASIDGVLVCEQVDGGIECVVGVSRDELFGPTIMCGIGGVGVELYRDVSFRVPPFGVAEARRMVTELVGSSLLTGYRGAPRADRAALVKTIMRVQRLAIDHSNSLVELDINPLLVRRRGQGVVALDALAVFDRAR